MKIECELGLGLGLGLKGIVIQGLIQGYPASQGVLCYRSPQGKCYIRVTLVSS